MVRYCKICKDIHDEDAICPKYKKQLKEHPEWFGEMVQTITNSSIKSSTVQKYGAAVKEHIVAYSGIDNQTGQDFKKSLNNISNLKVNPDYQTSNIKQHAGFAAEVQETARINAERVITGDTNRVVRYDDVGQTNHQLFDLIDIDADGNIIDGTGVQMKFIGGTPKACWAQLKSPKWQKYVDSNTPIRIPSDYYEKTLVSASNEIQKLKIQYQNLINNNEFSNEYKKT